MVTGRWLGISPAHNICGCLEMELLRTIVPCPDFKCRRCLTFKFRQILPGLWRIVRPCRDHCNGGGLTTLPFIKIGGEFVPFPIFMNLSIFPSNPLKTLPLMWIPRACEFVPPATSSICLYSFRSRSKLFVSSILNLSNRIFKSLNSVCASASSFEFETYRFVCSSVILANSVGAWVFQLSSAISSLASSCINSTFNWFGRSQTASMIVFDGTKTRRLPGWFSIISAGTPLSVNNFKSRWPAFRSGLTTGAFVRSGKAMPTLYPIMTPSSPMLGITPRFITFQPALIKTVFKRSAVFCDLVSAALRNSICIPAKGFKSSAKLPCSPISIGRLAFSKLVMLSLRRACAVASSVFVLFNSMPSCIAANSLLDARSLSVAKSPRNRLSSAWLIRSAFVPAPNSIANPIKTNAKPKSSKNTRFLWRNHSNLAIASRSFLCHINNFQNNFRFVNFNARSDSSATTPAMVIKEPKIATSSQNDSNDGIDHLIFVQAWCHGSVGVCFVCFRCIKTNGCLF